MQVRREYPQALELRLQGKTYGEIRRILKIPKSTQSGWFKNLSLTDETKRILATKQRAGLIALGRFNQSRTHTIKQENESIRKAFADKIKVLNTRNLALIGAALYWAEGYNNFNQKRGRYPHLGFTNSDPEMVVIFIRFLKKILRIGPNDLRGEIHIQPNLSAEKSLAYWHGVTGIPEMRLRVYRALSRASKGKRPKHLLLYGTLQLKVNRRQEFFKVKGLIDGIIKNIKNESA